MRQGDFSIQCIALLFTELHEYLAVHVLEHSETMEAVL